MTHALNLTLPIKQDPETLAKLNTLADVFSSEIQQKIEGALRKSKLVHFARVLVINNKYIQVITEYEGSHAEYAEFFREALTPIFIKIFELAEGAPNVEDANAFWEYAKSHNIRSLGMTTGNSTTMDGDPAGWLFSAYGHKTVHAIQDALNETQGQKTQG